METPILQLKKGGDVRVKSGHPWVFNNELESLPRFDPGTIVDLRDCNHHFIGRGYYNLHSLISIRILTRDLNEDINGDFFKKRILQAYEYRRSIYPHDDSYRLIYSEGDYLPGLIVDKYSTHLVIQTLTAGIEKWKETICHILQDLFQPLCLYERSDSGIRELEKLEPVSQVFLGKPDKNLIIEQDSVQFYVDIQEGQKTGFFFDHRENRNYLKNKVIGKTVLDLFCGSGSWSLYAAHFGAKKVIGIDSSKQTLELAKRNCSLNSFDSICSFIHEDAFEGAARLLKENQCFDVVICDPPAFAKSKRHLPTAIKGYQKINRMAVQLVKPGGILITSSCSYHINREIFRNILIECAKKTHREMKILRYGSQALDHPILLNVPETEYLKCLALQVD
jgi:23S rRNA (cytosine1962-C5)-methyltransferase